MHGMQTLGRQPPQPIAEACDLGTIRRAGRRNQPVAESRSLVEAVATIARVVAETAADEQVDLALDEFVPARGLQHPQADSCMRGTEFGKRPTAQVEAGVQAQLEQRRRTRRL